VSVAAESAFKMPRHCSNSPDSFCCVCGGIFVGLQIRELLKDEHFESVLISLELEAWKSFKNVCEHFLGNNRADNCKLFIDMKIAVFWVVAPCSLVKVYQRFRGPCCLHHQGNE
jgi:hypothetical protein